MTNEVTAEVIIELPRQDAWTTLRDLSLAANYVPGLARVEMSTTPEKLKQYQADHK
jgi:hypothetical protein